MKLYNIYCGFYDEELANGIFEFHVVLPIAAEDLESAKKTIRQNDIFKRKKMHIDGIQEVSVVNGYKINLSIVENVGVTIIMDHLHRDL